MRRRALAPRLFEIVGVVLITIGSLAGAWIISTLIQSHVIFIEARTFMLAIAGIPVWLGGLLLLVGRLRRPGSNDQGPGG